MRRHAQPSIRLLNDAWRFRLGPFVVRLLTDIVAVIGRCDRCALPRWPISVAVANDTDKSVLDILRLIQLIQNQACSL